jgi:hypothetical protein
MKNIYQVLKPFIEGARPVAHSKSDAFFRLIILNSAPDELL